MGDPAPESKSTRAELNAIHEAIRTLSDGKWDRHDIVAVATILGSLAGLISAGVLAAQQLGIL